jgi:hypothetical protein
MDLGAVPSTSTKKLQLLSVSVFAYELLTSVVYVKIHSLVKPLGA